MKVKPLLIYAYECPRCKNIAPISEVCSVCLSEFEPTDIQDIGDEIESIGTEHITTDGIRFFGVSIAEVHRILKKYGYKYKEPF